MTRRSYARQVEVGTPSADRTRRRLRAAGLPSTVCPVCCRLVGISRRTGLITSHAPRLGVGHRQCPGANSVPVIDPHQPARRSA